MPVPPVARLLRRPGGQRRAVLRDGLRRRSRRPRPGDRPRRRSTPDGARQRQPLARRHDGGDPRRRPRRRRARRPRPPRGLHRPPAQALVRPVGPAARPASCRSSTEVHDALAARIPEQGPATIVHGDYRLDNCMVVPTTATSSPCSTGRSARSATRSPTSGCCTVYWTGPGRRAQRVDAGERPRPPTGSGTGASSPPRYAEVSGRDLSEPRLLRRVRLLEAGLHPRRRVRAVPRRRARRPRPGRARAVRRRRSTARDHQGRPSTWNGCWR